MVSISYTCVFRDAHGIAKKNDRLASWLMISLAVSSSTVAVSSDIYTIFNGVGG